MQPVGVPADHRVDGADAEGVAGDRDVAPQQLGPNFTLVPDNPLSTLEAQIAAAIIAVEIDGAAVVFPSRSRWAKSSLVSSLVQQGCGYLSDEYAVVSAEGAVFPLSKPIHHWKGDGGVTREVGGSYASVPGGFRCSAVILTEYQEGAAWNPRPLTSAEAARQALSTALQGVDHSDQVMKAIAALVRDAACYHGIRGCGEFLIDSLRDLLSLDNVGQEARA